MRLRPLCAALLLLSGCATVSTQPAGEEVRWSGVVEIAGRRVLPRGTALVLEPGTKVVFKTLDSDGDGLGDSSLTIEAGSLTSLGTLDKPVVLTGEGSAPGSWGEVRLDFSKVSLTYTVLEGSTRGLHLHFTSGRVEDSIFRSNVDSTRLGESSVELSRCLFSENTGKGYNARASSNTVRDSWFRENRRGLFLFEEDRGSVFSGLKFTGNDTPVRLGDFFEGEVKVSGRLGDESPPTPLGPSGFLSDQGQKATLLWEDYQPKGVGPRGWPLLDPLWATALNGFVDADPFADERGVWAADWSGALYRVSLLTGEVLAKNETGDTIDGTPLVFKEGGRELLAAQNWGRRLILADALTLAGLSSFTEEVSPADDHRQSAAVSGAGRLFAASWAGLVRGFEVSSGALRELWSIDVGSPVRAGLAFDAARLYVATSGGLLLALDANGRELWRKGFGSPLLSTPALDAGRIYIGTRDGKLSALNGADGNTIWSTQLCGAAWYAPPMAHEGRVFQGDDGGCLSSFDAVSGKLHFRLNLDGGVRSRPGATGDSVAVSTLGGSLYLIDQATGIVRDRLVFDGPLQSSPFALGDLLYFGGRDSFLRGARVLTNETK